MKLDSILLMFIGGMCVAMLVAHGPLASFSVVMAFASGFLIGKRNEDK